MTGCALTLSSCAARTRWARPRTACPCGSTARASAKISAPSSPTTHASPRSSPNGTGAVHAACGTLVTDAEMANTELPSPDPEVTDLLTKAYGLEGTVGNECYDAGSTNKQLLAESSHNAIKAEALYNEVLQRIRAIDGQVPVTTTTVGNSGNTGEASSDDDDGRGARSPPPPGAVGHADRPLPDRQPAGDEVNLMTANLVVQVCLEPKLVAVALEREAVTRLARARPEALQRLSPPSRRARRGPALRQARRRGGTLP